MNCSIAAGAALLHRDCQRALIPPLKSQADSPIRDLWHALGQAMAHICDTI